MFFLDGGGYCCGRSSFLGLCPRNKKPTHDDIVFLLGSLHLFVGWVCGVSFVFTRKRRVATVEHMLFQAPKAQHKRYAVSWGSGLKTPSRCGRQVHNIPRKEFVRVILVLGMLGRWMEKSEDKRAVDGASGKA